MNNGDIIKTVYDNQYEIIKSIEKLYVPDGFDVDPTYSKGVFYKTGEVQQPRRKFDLFPRTDDTVEANANNLPLDDASVGSIMFDPPFLAGYTKPKPTGVMGKRFHGFRYVNDLWDWYDECLSEFSRVLKKNGVLVFKCQDTVSSGKNWFSHCFIMNKAIQQGFYPRDMFVLTAKSRLIGHNHGNQKHARKFHSYFWVFEKKSHKIPYNL